MSKIRLIHGDFFDPQYAQKLAKVKFDLIVTDPPYNIADRGKVTKAHGKIYSNKEAWGDVFKDSFTREEYDEFIKRFLRSSFVLLKPGGSLVTFIDDKYSGVLTRFAEEINAESHEKNPEQPRGFAHKKNIHFVKVNCVPKIRAYNYASACEVAVWMVKPRLGKGKSTAKPAIFNYQKPTKDLRYPNGDLDIRRYHNTYSSNVFFYNIGNKKFGHPTEKYEDMLRPLIETHSNPGSVVLDPFAGSFMSGLICRRLGRSYVGFEIDEQWVIKARAAIAEEISSSNEQNTDGVAKVQGQPGEVKA